MRRRKFKLSENAARRLRAAGGVGLIAVGIPLIPFPLPVGGIVTATGVTILARNSRTVQKGVDKVLDKYPDLPRKYRQMGRKLKKMNPLRNRK